jgi:hypothetical protein
MAMDMNTAGNLLGQLLGNNQQRQEYQDFVNRYQQGSPEEGYTDQEVMNRYEQVAPRLPQQDYVRAAQEAFDRMSPQQRAEFGQYVQQQAQQRGVNIPGMGGGASSSQYEDSGYLAQMAGQLHQQQPGLLGQLLGGGGDSGSGAGSMLNNPIAKAALAGIAAMAVKNMMKR